MPIAHVFSPRSLLAMVLLSFSAVCLQAAEGWLSAVSFADPEGKWRNESAASDGAMETYAVDRSNRTGNGAWIEIGYDEPVRTDRLRVAADYGFDIVDRVDIEGRVDSEWIELHSGAIENAVATDILLSATVEVDRLRLRFHYLSSGYYFWLYDLQLYERLQEVTAPSVISGTPTSVTGSTAVIHGTVDDDGGAPCEARLRWGLDAGCENAGPWVDGLASGEQLSLFLENLAVDSTYHFCMEARNGLDLVVRSQARSFSAVPLDPGEPQTWWPLTGYQDPEGAWKQEASALDDNPATAARCYHALGDQKWSPYLILDTVPTRANGVRFRPVGNEYVDAIDIDVLRGGDWVDVYQGSYDADVDQMRYFASGQVAALRIRLRSTREDAGFYFRLSEVDLHRNSAPTVELVAPIAGASHPPGKDLLVQAQVTDPDTDDSISKVDFFADGVKVGEATEAPFSVSWADVPSRPGGIVLHAVATDTWGATGRSESVAITCQLPGKYVGPFRWAMHLLDPTSPQPHMIARNAATEDARLLSGGIVAGVLETKQWVRDNQAGTGSWGAGNTLVGDPGKNYWVGLGDWAIRECSDYENGEWAYYHRRGQDAQLRFGFTSADGAKLNVVHADAPALSGVFQEDAIVVELAFRNRIGGGTAWQLGDYGGSPVQVGVWQIPAGSSMSQAQADDANRLGELEVLQELTPEAPILFRLDILDDGHWALAVDLDGDHATDVDLLSMAGGPCRPSDLLMVTESSGLHLTALPARGVHPGDVGLTDVAIKYREATGAALPETPRDRRPLEATIAQRSRVSPLSVHGRRWDDTRAVHAYGVTLGSTGVEANYIGDRAFYLDVPLQPDGPLQVTLRQSGVPTSEVTGTVYWESTDLYHIGESTLRAGSSLLFTYAEGYVEGDLFFDAGRGAGPVAVTPGELWPTRYDDPGTYVARVYEDMDGDGALTPDEAIGEHVVRVVGVFLPTRIAAQVGFARPVIANTGRTPANQVRFEAADPSALAVEVVETAGNVALLTARPLRKEDAVLQAWLPGSGDGAESVLAATRSVKAFTLHVAGRASSLVADATGLGSFSVGIEPALPDLRIRLEMHASTAAFAGGKKSLELQTGSVDGSGDFTVKDVGGAERAVAKVTLGLPPGENAYCFKVRAYDRDEVLPASGADAVTAQAESLGVMKSAQSSDAATDSGEVDVPAGETMQVNGKVCRTILFKTLIFTKADPDEDEVKDGTAEVWNERSFVLVSEEVCESEDCEELKYEVKLGEFTGAGANVGRNPLKARFLSDGCKPCDNKCEAAGTIMTGVLPGKYETLTEGCDVPEGDEVKGGSDSFWVVKLDAHGPDDDGAKFPDYAEVLPKRSGTWADPVIRIDLGGQDNALYGVGTVESTLVDDQRYDWEHKLDAICSGPTNYLDLSAIALPLDAGAPTVQNADGQAAQGTIAPGFAVEWYESDSLSDGWKPAKTEVLKWATWKLDGASGTNKEKVKLAWNPGRWYVKMEVYQTHAWQYNDELGREVFAPLAQPVFRGKAEIHSFAVEEVKDSFVPKRADEDVDNPVGTPFYVSNYNGPDQWPVDARLAIGGGPARVALEGYPQNEYWNRGPAGGARAQVVKIPEISKGGIQKFFLQGYDTAVTNDGLKLMMDGQPMIEDCTGCHIHHFGPEDPVQEPEWMVTDTERFTSVLVDVDMDSDNEDGVQPPDRSAIEEGIEFEDLILPAWLRLPGKYIQVNDGDADNDGVPNWADGYDIYGNEAAEAGGEYPPGMLALDDFRHIAEEPEKVRVEYPLGSVDEGDVPQTQRPLAYPPAGGGLRMWAKQGMDARTKDPVTEGGDLILPQEYPLPDLPIAPIGGLRGCFVEAIGPSAEIGDLEVSFVSVHGSTLGPIRDDLRITAIQCDIDVDSDNQWLGGDFVSSEAYQDNIEQMEGFDEKPGVYVLVGSEGAEGETDPDRDGKPNFADGMIDENEQDGVEEGGDVDRVEDRDAFQPVKLRLLEPIDIEHARVLFRYDDSDPQEIIPTHHAPLRNPDGDAPGLIEYVPDEGHLRLWLRQRDDDNPAKRDPESIGAGGDFIPADEEFAAREIFADGNEATVYVESVRPSASVADLEIVFEVDPNSEHLHPGFMCSDRVRVSAVVLDVDVDSDNDNGVNDADRSFLEDQIEDLVDFGHGSDTGEAWPGKLVQVNTGDDDCDGRPGYAEGIVGLWPLDGALSDDQSDVDFTQEWFVPLHISLPKAIPLKNMRLVILDKNLPSVPDAMTRDGAGTHADPYVYKPALGKLRLWRRPAMAQRAIADFIEHERAYEASDLSDGGHEITLYIEGITASESVGDTRLDVLLYTDSMGRWVDPDEDDPEDDPEDDAEPDFPGLAEKDRRLSRDAVVLTLVDVRRFKSSVFPYADDPQEDEQNLAGGSEPWVNDLFGFRADYGQNDGPFWSLMAGNGFAGLEWLVRVDPTATGKRGVDNPEFSSFDANPGQRDSDPSSKWNGVEVTPHAATGTRVGKVPTDGVIADDSTRHIPDDSYVFGHDFQNGAYWASRIDAHGSPPDGEDGKFPKHAPALKRRPGTIYEPVIAVIKGGLGYPSNQVALYGLTPDAPDPRGTHGEDRARWRFMAVARDPADPAVNVPSGVTLRWALSNGRYPGLHDGDLQSGRGLPGGFEAVADAPENEGGQPVLIDADFAAGRWEPRLEVIRDGEVIGVAEIHSLVVESEPGEALDDPPSRVEDALIRGASFSVSNLGATQDSLDVDVRLSVDPSGRDRGRVSLDGYPQNQYWCGRQDDHDLAQYLPVAEGEAVEVWLQGYDGVHPETESDSDHGGPCLVVQAQAFEEIFYDPMDPFDFPPAWLKKSPARWRWFETDRQPFLTYAKRILVRRMDAERPITDVLEEFPSDRWYDLTGSARAQDYAVLSSPRPGIVISDVQIDGQGVGDPDTAITRTVTIEGYVRDRIADVIKEREAVDAGGADIKSIDAFIHGSDSEAASVDCEGKTEDNWTFWAPYPYRGEFELEIQDVEMRHFGAEILLRTSANVAGNCGWLRLFIRIDQQGAATYQILDDSDHGLDQPFLVQYSGSEQSQGQPDYEDALFERVDGRNLDIGNWQIGVGAQRSLFGGDKDDWASFVSREVGASDNAQRPLVFHMVPRKSGERACDLCFCDPDSGKLATKSITLPELDHVPSGTDAFIEFKTADDRDSIQWHAPIAYYGPGGYADDSTQTIRERRHAAGMGRILKTDGLGLGDERHQHPLGERIPVHLRARLGRGYRTNAVRLKLDGERWVQVFEQAGTGEAGEAEEPVLGHGSDGWIATKNYRWDELPETLWIHCGKDTDLVLSVEFPTYAHANASDSWNSGPGVVEETGLPGFDFVRDELFGFELYRLTGGLGSGSPGTPMRQVIPGIGSVHLSRGNVHLSIPSFIYPTPVLNPDVGFLFNGFDGLRELPESPTGWMTNYHQRTVSPFLHGEIMEFDEDVLKDSSLSFVYIDGTGQRHVFSVADDKYVSIATHSGLCGAELCYNATTGDSEVVAYDNMIRYFGDNGHLDYIRAIDGQGIAIRRGGERDEEITEVSDHYGRSPAVDIPPCLRTGQPSDGAVGPDWRPWRIELDPESGLPNFAVLGETGEERLYELGYAGEGPDGDDGGNGDEEGDPPSARQADARLASVAFPDASADPDTTWPPALRHSIDYGGYEGPGYASAVTIEELFGGTTAYQIDSSMDFLTAVTDAEGSVTSFVPDQQKHRVARHQRGRSVVQYSYDDHGMRTAARYEGSGPSLPRSWTYEALPGVKGSWVLVKTSTRGRDSTIEVINDGFGDFRTGAAKLVTDTHGGRADYQYTERGFLSQSSNEFGVTLEFTDLENRFGRWRKQATPMQRTIDRAFYEDDYAQLHKQRGRFVEVFTVYEYDGHQRLHKVYPHGPGGPAETIVQNIFDETVYNEDVLGVKSEYVYNVYGMPVSAGGTASGYAHYRYALVDGGGYSETTYVATGAELEGAESSTKTGVTTYDGVGRVVSNKTWISTPTPTPRVVSYDYTPEGWVERIKGPRSGEERIFHYYDAGLRSKVERTVSEGEYASTQMSYDDHGNTVSVIDPDGVVTTTTYDRGRPDTVTYADGRELVYGYNKTRVSTMTQTGRSPAKVLYNNDGERIGMEDPDGFVTKEDLERSEGSWQVVGTSAGPAGATLTTNRTTLDGRGYASNTVRVSFGDAGATSSTEFLDVDATGRPWGRNETAAGMSRSFRQEPAAHNPYLVAKTERTIGAVLKEVGRYSYHSLFKGMVEEATNLAHRVRNVIDAATGDVIDQKDNGGSDLGSVNEVLERDLAGNTLRWRDGDGFEWSRMVDLGDRERRRESPSGHVNEQDYTPGGRNTERRASGPDGDLVTVRLVEHDAAGRPAIITNPVSGVETRREYYSSGAPAGLVRSVTQGSLTTSYTYENRRVATKTDSNGTTVYEYYQDGPHTGRLNRMTRPGGLTEAYKYYLDGKLRERSGNGLVESYEYDEAGRLDIKTVTASEAAKADVKDPDGQITYEYEYNSDGTMAKMTVNGVEKVYQYDEYGRLQGIDGEMIQEFDARGRVRAINIPGQDSIDVLYRNGGRGHLVQERGGYVYNYENGRISEVTDLATDESASYAYWNSSNLIKEASLPGGIKRKFEYFADGRQRQVETYANNDFVSQFGYEYDTDGRLTDMSATTPLWQRTYGFIYDGSGRLDAEVCEDDDGLVYRREYAYEGAAGARGNITSIDFETREPVERRAGTEFDLRLRRDQTFAALRLPASLPHGWNLSAEAESVGALRWLPLEDAVEVLPVALNLPDDNRVPLGLYALELRARRTVNQSARAGMRFGSQVEIYARYAYNEVDNEYSVRVSIAFDDDGPGGRAPRVYNSDPIVLPPGSDGWFPTATLRMAARGSGTRVELVTDGLGGGLAGAAIVERKVVLDAPVSLPVDSWSMIARGGAEVEFDRLAWMDLQQGDEVSIQREYTPYANRLVRSQRSDGSQRHFAYNYWGGLSREVAEWGAWSEVSTYDYDSLMRRSGIRVEAGSGAVISNQEEEYIGTGWMRRASTINGVRRSFAYDGHNIRSTNMDGETTVYANVPGGRWARHRQGLSEDELRVYMSNGRGDVNGYAVEGQVKRWMTYDAYGRQQSYAYNDGAWERTDGASGPGYRGLWHDATTEHIYMRHRYYDPSIERFTKVDPAQAGNNWYAYAGGDPV
ncbi:MAG: RHS repeat-associated core domain-containing protein, partial [Planctomycetota bacterium]